MVTKKKNILKAKDTMLTTPPALLNNVPSPVKNPVHLRFDSTAKNYDSNITHDSVIESAVQSENFPLSQRIVLL